MLDFNIHELIKKIDDELSTDPENKESLGWFRSVFGNLPNSQINALNYFMSKMPKENDLLKIVITGHLLIEQQVKIIFQSNFINEAPIKSCRLETSQIISLVEAMYEPTDKYSALWKCIKKLNNIRNDLAHNLECVGLEHKIEDFVKQVKVIISFPKDKGICVEDALRNCITGLSAWVISLSTHAFEDKKSRSKASAISRKYKHDYIGFDNAVNEIIFDTEIDRGERDRFSKSLNNYHLRLLGALDITNSEYIDATHGALLAARERKECVTPDKLKDSLKMLGEQHAEAIKDIRSHFIEVYNDLTDEIHHELETELEFAISEVVKT